MKCQDCVAFVVCKKKTKLLQLDEHTWEEAYRCEGVEKMCPYFKHEFDDPIFKTYCSIHAKISEKEEEIIIRTIQEIGGETFHEITIDRNKVLEALTMYKNKADYAEVKHGEWKAYGLANPQCSICHSYNIEKSRYCPNCGSKMKGGVEE